VEINVSIDVDVLRGGPLSAKNLIFDGELQNDAVLSILGRRRGRGGVLNSSDGYAGVCGK